MITRILAAVITALLVSCSSSTVKERFTEKEPTLVKAKLVEYVKGAYWSHFSDGHYEVFDASKFEILEPIDLCGVELYVYHGDTMEESSPWRGQGVLYELSIAPRRAAALKAEAAGKASEETFFGTGWVSIVGETESTQTGCESDHATAP